MVRSASWSTKKENNPRTDYYDPRKKAKNVQFHRVERSENRLQKASIDSFLIIVIIYLLNYGIIFDSSSLQIFAHS